MGATEPGTARSYLQTLFTTGTVGSLADAQLLERFAGHDDAAAFEALVDRHGPMVLRVCRSMLADPHDAEDALQATFLVLVRRARSIRKRDSLASWLFGVAARVAARARVDAARRRKHEQKAVTIVRDGERDRDGPDLGPILHEELARLPEMYREALVLYYLEGQSCEASAARLRSPVGTVKARLARARDLLRHRLRRRGVELPASLVAPGEIVKGASSVVPAPLVRSALDIATAAVPAATPANVRILAQGVLRAMLLPRLAFVVAVAALAAGAATTAMFMIGRKAPPVAPPAIIGREAPQVAPPVDVSSAPAQEGTPPPPPPPGVEPLLVLKDTSADLELIGNPLLRTWALRLVANAQVEAGDPDAARGTLRLAEQFARLMTNEVKRDYWLNLVAIALARAGDPGAARQIVGGLLRDADGLPITDRAIQGAILATDQNRAGLHAEAIETLRTALAAVDRGEGDDDAKRHALFHIVRGQSIVSDFDGALALAARFKGEQSHMRATYFEYIAQECVKAGPATARRVLAEALDLSRSIDHTADRERAQCRIAEAMAQSGDISGALETVRAVGASKALDHSRRIALSYACDVAQCRIAEAMARSGDIWGALETVRAVDASRYGRIGILREFPKTLTVIAVEQAKANRREAAKALLLEATKAVRALPAGIHQSHARELREIAEAQAEVGDVANARKTAALILNDSAQAIHALVAIARRQNSDGDRKAALATLQVAGSMVGSNTASGVITKSALPTGPVGNTSFPLGNTVTKDGSVHVLDRVNNGFPPAPGEALMNSARNALVLGLAEAGNFAGAHATIASFRKDDSRDLVLSQLASIEVHRGDVEGARRTAGSILVPIGKYEAFLQVAWKHAQAGGDADALAWARTLDTPEARVCARVGVARGLTARQAVMTPTRPPAAANSP